MSLYTLNGPTDHGLWRFTVVLARRSDSFLLVYNIARQIWELPGGRRELGERPIDCARRELLEEGGAVGHHFRRWGILRVSEPRRSLVGIIFACEVVRCGPVLVPSEIASARYWLPAESIDDLGSIDRVLIDVAIGRSRVMKLIEEETTWQLLRCGV